MMLPCLGLLRGTQTITRVPSPLVAARSLTVSSSLPPPSVSFATTRMVLIGSRSSSSLGGRLGVGARRGRLGLRRRGRPADAVDRPRHAVLVGAADDGRNLVEVEPRRRRGDLPLEGERPP